MTAWTDTLIGNEIDLAYGKSLPAHARETGPYRVFGSNGCVGHHTAPLISGPGIVVGRKGSVGEVVYSEGDFWPIDTTYYVVNKGGHDWRFLFHLLSSLGLTKLNSHSAVPGLNREDVYSICVSLPEVSEQRQIAKALDTIQESFRLEAKTVALAGDLKRAAMRTLFTKGLHGEAQKETEIGPVPQSWHSPVLEKVARLSTGTTPATKRADFYEGTVPFIKTAEIVNNRIKGSSTFVSDEAIKQHNLKVYPPGTVFMAMYGQGKTRGQASLLEIPAATSQNAAAIEINEGLLPEFLWHYLLSRYDYLRGIGSLGHLSHLNLGYLRGLCVPQPSNLDEQREIAAILDAIDRKIDLHRRKRDVLDELFKAMLHKLMIGAIRVTDLDLAALDTGSVAA